MWIGGGGARVGTEGSLLNKFEHCQILVTWGQTDKTENITFSQLLHILIHDRSDSALCLEYNLCLDRTFEFNHIFYEVVCVASCDVPCNGECTCVGYVKDKQGRCVQSK